MRISYWSSDVCSSDLWSFFSYVAYHVPATGIGKFSLQPELRGVGKINYSITNDPIAYDSAHVFVNLRASWESEDGTYNAQAFVTNLFRNRSMLNPRDPEIGRAACRERVCEYV